MVLVCRGRPLLSSRFCFVPAAIVHAAPLAAGRLHRRHPQPFVRSAESSGTIPFGVAVRLVGLAADF
jgi:hypothetical protein